jgi:hypothetical protein
LFYPIIFFLCNEKHCQAASCQRKHLNISILGLIEEAAVKRTGDKITQVSVVLTTVVAWLSISNHCALGAVIDAQSQDQLAPTHCHGNQASPPKKSGDKEEMPCCKALRATLAGEGKIVKAPAKDFLAIHNWIVPEIIFANQAQLAHASQELDTGPPFAAGSFAESVLQRSILAHAPPSLA